MTLLRKAVTWWSDLVPIDSVAEGRWESIGPAPLSFPGGTFSGRAAAVALRDAQTWYVVSAGGGVWSTTDAGSTWIPLTDGQPSLAGGTIVLDPADPDRIWVGTGEANGGYSSHYGAGILKSIDAGRSWQQRGAAFFGGARIAKLALDPSSPQSARVLYAAAMGALGVDRERGLALTPGLARSNDGGDTWTFPDTSGVFPPGAWASDVLVSPTGTVFAARYGIGDAADRAATGIYRSVDAANHFTRLTSGLPSDWTAVGRIALALAPSNPQILYAVLARGVGLNFGDLIGVFRSDDGGDIWAQMPFTDPRRQWDYDIAVAVHPSNADSVWIGGIVLYQLDALSQSSRPVPIGHPDHHGIAFLPSNPQIMVVVNDGGVFASDDGGNHFRSANGAPPNALCITQGTGGAAHPSDPSIFYLGTQDNGEAKYSGALGWEQLLGGDAGRNEVDYNAPNVIYVCLNGAVLRSEDAGVHWMNIDPPSAAGGSLFPTLVMDPVVPTTLYLCLTRVHKTINRGNDWTALSPIPLGGGLSALAVSGNTIYGGDRFGAVWATRNGGANWSGPFMISNGLPGGINEATGRYLTALAVGPADDRIAYATYAGFNGYNAVAGHVFKTVNAGVNWTDVSSSLLDAPVDWILADRQVSGLLYIAGEAGVFKSADCGATWTPLNDGLPGVPVWQVVVNRAGYTMFAVTHGRGVYRANRSLHRSIRLAVAWLRLWLARLLRRRGL